MRVLDDASIRQMISNPLLVKNFPFLTIKLPTSKPACCGEPPKTSYPDYQKIKAGIASLDEEQVKQLLTTVGLGQVRVIFKNGDKIADRVVG